MTGPVARYYSAGEFPAECIRDCTAQGDCAEAIAYWRARLGFEVHNVEAARFTLREAGYEPERVDAMTEDELADHILWQLAYSFREGADVYPVGSI